MDLKNFGIVQEKKLKSIDDKKLEPNFEEITKNLQGEEIERFLPWFLKYQIKDERDLIETEQIKKIRSYFEKPTKNKGLLLVGNAGCGKTTTLILFAKKYEYEIFEMNASDCRNKKIIEKELKSALNQNSLSFKKKIFLIDEVDGVSSVKDRGGISEIVKYVKKFSKPFIFTANSKDVKAIKDLKKVCQTIDFEKHQEEVFKKLAEKILNKEKIKYEEKEVEDFIKDRNSYDIRGFINDLQASSYNKTFNSKDLENRSYKKEGEEILRKIFYSYPQDALNSLRNSNIKLDDLFLLIEENIQNIYDKNGVYNGFNLLSKADVFRGRIYKWQYYRYLVYISFYLSFGVCASKKEVEKKDKFEENKRFLKKWILQNKFHNFEQRTKLQKKTENERFIEKLSKVLKRSVKKTRNSDLFYIAFMIKNNKDFEKKFKENFLVDTTSFEKLLN